MCIELNDQLGDDKINFDFNDGDNGRFFTTGDALNISIGSHGDADQLLHEMFHAYQSFQGSHSWFNSGKMNMEIEAHYAQYLHVSGRNDYEGSIWEERDNNDHHRKSVKGLEKLIDEKGNLRDGTSEDDLTMRLVSVVIPAFQAVDAYKDYAVDYDRTDLTNFNTLRGLTTEC